MTADNIAWAAGLIEGEGSIYSSVRAVRAKYDPSRRYIVVRVRVVMTDRDVVEKVCAIVGAGKVSPYVNTQGLGKKPLYRWEVSRRQTVEALCSAIYPWMGHRRRAQIDRVRELLQKYPETSGAERSKHTWITRRANAAAAQEAQQ